VGEGADKSWEAYWYVITMDHSENFRTLIMSVGDLSVGDRVLREEEVERLGSGDTLVVSDR
jgi:hypothetical protein